MSKEDAVSGFTTQTSLHRDPKRAKTARNASEGDGFKPFLAASTPLPSSGPRHTKWPEVKEPSSLPLALAFSVLRERV